MKQVVASLRARGFIPVVYLDDFWIMGNSYEDCLQNVQKTISFLTQLGFIVNERKSTLTPSHTWQFLGFIFNSKTMIIPT
jgi:hypothetical protein